MTVSRSEVPQLYTYNYEPYVQGYKKHQILCLLRYRCATAVWEHRMPHSHASPPTAPFCTAEFLPKTTTTKQSTIDRCWRKLSSSERFQSRCIHAGFICSKADTFTQVSSAPKQMHSHRFHLFQSRCIHAGFICSKADAFTQVSSVPKQMHSCRFHLFQCRCIHAGFICSKADAFMQVSSVPMQMHSSRFHLFQSRCIHAGFICSKADAFMQVLSVPKQMHSCRFHLFQSRCIHAGLFICFESVIHRDCCSISSDTEQ